MTGPETLDELKRAWRWDGDWLRRLELAGGGVRACGGSREGN